MSNVWYKALMATPPVVYGRRLRPFSLCHRMTLREFNNPLLIGGKVTLEDVYTAVEVCRRTRKELQRDLFKIRTPRRFLSWALRWYTIRKKTPIAIASIQQYISDFSDEPKHSTPENKGDVRMLKAPSDLVLHYNLCKYGYHPDEAWDVACGLARCYYDVREEKEMGDTTLLSLAQTSADEVHSQAMKAERAGNTAEAERLYAIEKKMIQEAL